MCSCNLFFPIFVVIAINQALYYILLPLRIVFSVWRGRGIHYSYNISLQIKFVTQSSELL
jgi:hypothetical protein